MHRGRQLIGRKKATMAMKEMMAMKETMAMKNTKETSLNLFAALVSCGCHGKHA